MKHKRRKVQRDWLENQLAKCERRIQKIAEQAYYIRKAIALLDQQEAIRNQEKGDIENALHNSAVEGLSSGGKADQDTGESNIPDPTGDQAVLGQ